MDCKRKVYREYIRCIMDCNKKCYGGYICCIMDCNKKCYREYARLQSGLRTRDKGDSM